MSSVQKSYVVEHMEPEMGSWSTLEYVEIAKETVQAGSRFYITSLQQHLVEQLPDSLEAYIDGKAIVATTVDVTALEGVDKGSVCLLDPQAEHELVPGDGDRFDWFVFGGILGNDPPNDRTSELRKYGYTGRNLKKIQMTTDTAVRVTRMVVEGKQSLDNIPYVDYPKFKITKNESAEMPFRYVRGKNSLPVVPSGVIEIIKGDTAKSLDELFL